MEVRRVNCPQLPGESQKRTARVFRRSFFQELERDAAVVDYDYRCSKSSDRADRPCTS